MMFSEEHENAEEAKKALQRAAFSAVQVLIQQTKSSAPDVAFKAAREILLLLFGGRPLSELASMADAENADG